MIIYLVSAPGHENSGYGDALVDAGGSELLVSFLEFADTQNPLQGFTRSDKTWPSTSTQQEENTP